MPIQCTVCGTQTRSGAKFCHACGTPIATASLPSTLPLGAVPPVAETKTAPPPPTSTTASQPVLETEPMNIPSSYLPQTPQTYHTPPPVAMAPTKKSGNTLKVVLISLAVIMALGIAMIIGAGYYVGRKASRIAADIKHRGGLPNVSNNADSVPDDKLGVPIYPEAKRENTVSGSFGQMSGAIVTFSTKDSVDEVAEFYRNHFKGQKDQPPSEISDVGNDDGQDSVVFQVKTDDGSRIITISPHDKKRNQTEIVVIVGNGVPGMPQFPGPPPPPPPAPRNSAERRAQELERQALEQAEKVLRDLNGNAPPPPPPPPPRR